MLKLPCKILISQLLTQVEVVSVQNSQDWIMVQATARALQVCAAALYRYSKQSANNAHRQTSSYQQRQAR